MKGLKKLKNYLIRFRKKGLFFLGLTVIAIVLSIVYYRSVAPRRENPLDLVLWVWERPENLYFMKKEKVTYAYLAGTITKTDTGLTLYFRQQPLRIPDDSTTVATIRIEDKAKETTFGDSDIQEISDFVVSACLKDRKNISCQIDFDAGQSQIDFYKKLILAVRSKLPEGVKLSLTALLSWCIDNDPWFDNLPLDEIVPMFFRLGKDSNIYWQKISQEDLILNPLCQKSIGISTDEQLPGKKYLKNKEIYIFNNDYWDKYNWGIIKARIKGELNEE